MNTIATKMSEEKTVADIEDYLMEGVAYFEMLKQRQVDPEDVIIEIDGDYINFTLREEP